MDFIFHLANDVSQVDKQLGDWIITAKMCQMYVLWSINTIIICTPKTILSNRIPNICILTFFFTFIILLLFIYYSCMVVDNGDKIDDSNGLNNWGRQHKVFAFSKHTRFAYHILCPISSIHLLNFFLFFCSILGVGEVHFIHVCKLFVCAFLLLLLLLPVCVFNNIPFGLHSFKSLILTHIV